MVLILFADFSSKLFLIAKRFFLALEESGLKFFPHRVVKKIIQSISISNLVLFKLDSEKLVARSIIFLLYDYQEGKLILDVS